MLAYAARRKPPLSCTYTDSSGRQRCRRAHTCVLHLERRLKEPEGKQQRFHLCLPTAQHAPGRQPVRLLPALKRALRLREADLEGHNARRH